MPLTPKQARSKVVATADRKPPNAGKGRKKGVPNKTTAAVKAALHAAYTGIGGDSTFIEWAGENKTEFYKLFAKLLPHEVTGPDGGPVAVTQVWQFGDKRVTF